MFLNSYILLVILQWLWPCSTYVNDRPVSRSSPIAPHGLMDLIGIWEEVGPMQPFFPPKTGAIFSRGGRVLALLGGYMSAEARLLVVAWGGVGEVAVVKVVVAEFSVSTVCRVLMFIWVVWVTRIGVLGWGPVPRGTNGIACGCPNPLLLLLALLLLFVLDLLSSEKVFLWNSWRNSPFSAEALWMTKWLKGSVASRVPLGDLAPPILFCIVFIILSKVPWNGAA